MNGFNSRIIFQSNAVAEFWYELQMNALQPPPAVLPIMQCELGKYVFYELLLFCSSSSSIKFYSTSYFLFTHLLSIRNWQKLFRRCACKVRIPYPPNHEDDYPFCISS